MKRFWLLLIGCSLILLTGCWTTPEEVPMTERMLYRDLDGANYSIPYSGELTIDGIGPEMGFLPDASEGTLIASQLFEDHADHLLFPVELWETYLKIPSDALPENIIFFEGEVEVFDTRAENNYYHVVTIDTLYKVKDADKDAIDQLLTKYAYCETDIDCTTYYASCPFGCWQGVNVKYLDISQKIIKNYRSNQEMQCEYGCVATTGVKCENYICVAQSERP